MVCFLKARRKAQIKFMIIHHSAGGIARNLNDLKRKAKSFDYLHSKKEWAEDTKTDGKFGYPYIAYHYLIAQNGDVMQVQDLRFSRYHATDCCAGDGSSNKWGMAIDIVGNFNQVKPSKASLRAVVKLIGDYEKKYKLNLIVRGHKDMYRIFKNNQCLHYPQGTECPGNNLYIFIKGGSKSKLVEWINYYEKTGKMPDELLDGKTCEDKLKEAQLEIEQLHHKLDLALKQSDKYKALLLKANDKIHEQGKLIVKLGGKIKMLEVELQKCKNDATLCMKIKILLVKLLKLIKEWLDKKLGKQEG